MCQMCVKVLMLTWFSLCCCHRGLQVSMSQLKAMSHKERKDNITERNEKKKKSFLWAILLWQWPIMPTVMEQECYEVCIQCLWDAEETSFQTKCGSSDRCWFMVPLLPSAPLSVFTIRLHLQSLYSIWSTNHPYSLFLWVKCIRWWVAAVIDSR